MSDKDVQQIADTVEELTRPRTNEQSRTYRNDSGTWVTEKHTTEVAPLLEQLLQALEPSGSGESGRAVPGSRPSARLDAIDTYHRIEQSAYLWCKAYATDRRWDSLTGKLRALVGCAGRIEEDEQHQLALEVRRWATWARVVTGWEVPPFRPNNSCPLCAVRGGLRVRLGDGVTSSDAHGMCVNCGEHWTPDTIGLLADHIRSENDEIEVAS
jgi:hypothetical protein